MSTKTLRKRIALVAVTALGAGVLSVAPANAAASAFGSFAGTAYCSATDAAGASVALSGNVRYLTVPVGAPITFVLGSGDAEVVKLTGAVAFSSSTATVTDEYTLNNDRSAIDFDGDQASTDTVTLTATIVGEGTVKVYDTAASSTATDSVTITVVASCARGVWSDADSLWEWNTADEAVGDTLSTSSVFSYVNADTAHLSIWGKNAYGSYLAEGTWQASVTGGCALDMDTTTATTSVGLLSTDALVGQTGEGIFVQIAQNAANENKPVTCAVTVSYDGTTVHTKSISFSGQLASIVASKPYNALIGDESFRVFTIAAFDSAGNRVVVTPTVDAARLTTSVTNVTSAATSLSGDITTGNSVTCGSTAGSAVVRLKAANADGVTVYSNEWTVNCAGKPATFTASLDKASYLPGDIATLTITAKDSKGNLVSGPGADAVGDTAADATISSLLGATTLHTIVGSQMEHVTAPAATDAFVNGVKTYQFKVGSTEGSYAMSVAIPDIATDVAKTVAYKVAGSGAVSNADVLKAIVSLIASINKQIAALQKALLKR